ncbi:Similar to Inpp1: Inositol polyphosphate 1-phosphatase (Mus musculus) [Cotesia congregata]|uniref:Similar to Inpp1: Inositol polyphosphate 1-phosphatase (Mus musculus) n=1 Tax=Cotesia congregata TaxID=51543 RepID=A0A8J2H9F2_COTCN|nr:Similar to Inpp1: Inositol polyphosphate 1-phosphatase (Mus musculus) [Cotesia congregata]
MKDGMKLLCLLLKSSEKAANIARVCRQNDSLFRLLIQEKNDDEKNPSNTLDKTVIVKVCSTSEETTKLLSQVLDDDVKTAGVLAMEIHRDIELSEINPAVDYNYLENYDVDLDITDLGIWIDPIDSTADYINANTIIDEATDLHLSGLKWQGNCYWGLYSGGKSQSSLTSSLNQNNIVVLSRYEDPIIKSKLSNCGFRLIEVTGAGYKILTVATGQADAYVLSKSSTYKWDTCGPHAIIRSLGGNIIDFKKFSTNHDEDPSEFAIKYNDGDEAKHSNAGGLIVYRNSETLQLLQKSLVLSTKL